MRWNAKFENEFVCCCFLTGIYSIKVAQSLQDLELQEQKEDKDEEHIGKLIRNSPQIKGVYYF